MENPSFTCKSCHIDYPANPVVLLQSSALSRGTGSRTEFLFNMFIRSRGLRPESPCSQFSRGLNWEQGGTDVWSRGGLNSEQGGLSFEQWGADFGAGGTEFSAGGTEKSVGDSRRSRPLAVLLLRVLSFHTAVTSKISILYPSQSCQYPLIGGSE